MTNEACKECQGNWTKLWTIKPTCFQQTCFEVSSTPSTATLIRELHEKAMDLADQADQLREKLFDPETLDRTWKKLLTKAAENEAKAARLMEDNPAHSILARSAANLYIGAGNWEEASKMATFGLSGKDVPDVIAEELQDILNEYKEQQDLIKPQERQDEKNKKE
jgi:hypothetical protein